MHPSYNRAARLRQDIRHQPKFHRYSIDAWDRIRDAIDREHRVIAASDPRSPRVRPTLAPVQWGVR